MWLKIYAFAHKIDDDAASDGKFALILEHGGANVASMVKKGLIAPCQIFDIINQVFTGLDYIHNFNTQMLIHRDIKPENIFVRRVANGKAFEAKNWWLWSHQEN